MAKSGYSRGETLNPLIVIAGFVIVLAILIYYLQSRETEPEEIPPREETEKNIVKVRDYVAQYNAEKAKEKPTEEPEMKEPLPEESTTEPAIEEPDKDDIPLLNGVGPKYQELLRAAGYISIKAVAESNPEDLYSTILKVNEEKGITKRPPTLKNIEEWIKSASSNP